MSNTRATTLRRTTGRSAKPATGFAACLTAFLLWPATAAAQDLDPVVLDNLLDFNKVVTSLIILAAALVVTRLGTATLDSLGERWASRRLLLKKVSSLGRFVIYFASMMVIIFGVVEPERETLIALFGTLAVAVGLALKDLIGSIIAGVIVLLDSPFQVGDRVQYGSTYGEVVEIGLRAVKINTLDDNVVSIPNNKFLTDVVASANDGALDMMVQIDFFIGIEEDHELAKRLVREATVTSRFVYLAKPVVVHVLDVAMETAYSTRIRSKLYISDTRFETAVQTDITERTKRAFHEHHIRPPYHIEHSVQTPKRDSA